MLPCPSWCPLRHLRLVPGDSLPFSVTPGFKVSAKHFQLTHNLTPGGRVTAHLVKFQNGLAGKPAAVSYDLEF